MLLPTVLALSLSAAPASEDVASTTRAWEEGRLKRLQAEDGWLTLVGLGWLKEGANSAGADGKAVVVFPDGAPKQVGTFTRSGEKVSFQPAAGVSVTRAVSPSPAARSRPTRRGAPSRTSSRWGASGSSSSPAATASACASRIPRPAPGRSSTGIPTYPPSARWRIVARWEPSNPPVEIAVPNVLGEVERSPSPGAAVFTIDGKEYRLTPVLEEGSPDLFFVFGDQTNRAETYGAGRFLYADPAKDGTVVLDFNRAYNPPCAFSAFATCPLPRSRTDSPCGSRPGRSASRNTDL